MKSKDPIILIHKSLTGQISTKEESILESWLQSPENKAVYEEIKSIWEATGEALPEEEFDQNTIAQVELKARLKEARRQEDKLKKAKKKNTVNSIAILLLALATGFLIITNINRSSSRTPETFVVATDPHDKTILPDQSVIYLNDRTTLTYHSSDDIRTTELSGEAFFEVYRDENKPFIVNTGTVTIKVLGTSFLVKAYPKEETVVSVISGNVLVSYGNAEISLEKGENLRITNSKEMKKTQDYDPNLLAWKTHELIFKNDELRNVIKDLKHFYKIKIEVSDPLMLECRFTGRFRDLDLKDVLDILAYSLNLKVEYIDFTHVRLSGKGCL